MLQNNNIFTIPQAAKHCSISRVTLWRWVKSGKLKAFLTPGGHYKIRKDDLDSFIRWNMKHLLNYDHLFHEKKILIVDDDIETQNLLTKFFTINNFHIKIASDGIDAGIKIVQFKPDIIILDISMSNVDGFEVCNRIKTDANNSHIKMLILTGYGTQENIDRAMEAGADAFIAKPIDAMALLERLEDFFNSSERQVNAREERAYL